QSVRELRNEVNAFIGGYATVAEKASIAKKTVLFFRRHILLTVILSMLLFFASVSALYMVQEYRRSLDGWKQVFVADFRKGGTFHAAAPGNGTLRPVRADGSGGVLLNSGEWLWLDHEISGNLKLEVTYTVIDPAETEFDLVFDAKDAPLATADSFPAGWCLRLAANGGWDILGRTETHSGIAPLPRDVKKSSVVPGKNTVTLVRENNRIRAFSGVGKQQKQLLEAKEVTTGQEKSLRRIGFRSVGTPVKITDVRISRQTVPSGPAQLYRAQILAEEGLYERAFEQYLTIAGLYPNDAFADEALIRAYALASFQLVDQPDFREKIRGVIESCPAFSRAADVAELDAMFLWHTGRHQEALVAAAKILSEQPDHPIVTRFLLLPRQKITDNNARNLFRQLVHSKAGRKLTWLDLSGLNLTGLDDIEKLEDLRWLNCSQNRITTMKPLKNTKLEYLDCSGNSALRNQEIPIPVKTLIKD
ncbi:MAG: leucine-rich repeat domain-containing protein, partial [Lentisphaeria bacterium]|nr:leucine-rich repeat domain-containing protein [Lentisphaeria bacterium]